MNKINTHHSGESSTSRTTSTQYPVPSTSPKETVWLVNQFAVTPDMAGGTRHYDFAKELVKKGYSVFVFASDFSLTELEFKKLNNEPFKIEIIDDVKFIWIRVIPYYKNNYRRILNQLSFAVNFYKTAIKMDIPDTIIGSSPQLFTAFSSMLISIRKKVKFIAEIRDLWPASLTELSPKMKYHPYTWLLAVLEWLVYKKAGHIIVFTEGNKHKIINKGIKDERISFIPNGIDPNIVISEEETERFRKNLDSSKFNICYAGNIGIANNLQLAVDAAVKLKDKNIHLYIVGNGPMRDSIRYDIKNRGLSNISILEPVSKKEIFSLLSSMDACFITLQDVPLFRYGVSPNKLFDYMFAGKPIICSVGGWSNELVEKAECGIAVEPGDTDAFVDAIIKLSQISEQDRAKLGNNGREYVIKHFSRPNLVNQLIRIISK